MQEIATSKSLLYGAIITFIFMISSCEFQFTSADASPTSPPSMVASKF